MTRFGNQLILMRKYSLALLVGTMLSMIGCAAGPDYKRPDAALAKTLTPENLPTSTHSSPAALGAAQQFNLNQNIPADWWKIFQSEKLNHLIERAFKNNPSIDSAQAALKQAQENVVAQQGFFYPSVGVSYSPSRNKLAGNMGGNSPGIQSDGTLIQTYSNPVGPVFNGPAYFNFHTAQLSLGYTPDIFGLNRRQTESLEAQAEAQRLQLAATYITLASNVIAAALEEASLRAQLAAVNQVVDLNRENLEILHKQLALGFVSPLDVATQQAALAQAEQALPPLTKQLAQTRNLIRALVGNAPDQELAETFELSELQLPTDLPLSLPSKIVEQRPDVRAAEAQLHAASALYGVALANRLPQFSLSANIGGMATNPGWMFDNGGQFFNLTANIGQLLFDGGSLKAKSRAAQQVMLQSAADYRSTVIFALQNVADTLYAIHADANAMSTAFAGQQATQTVLAITQKQYDLGFISYQNLLVAKQNNQLAQLSLVQAQAARLGDTAALYQALGGGWWQTENNLIVYKTSETVANVKTERTAP